MAERYDRDLTDLFELARRNHPRRSPARSSRKLLKFERERIAEQPQLNEDAYATLSARRVAPLPPHQVGIMSRRRLICGAHWRSMRTIRKPRRRWRSRSATPPISAGRSRPKPTMPKHMSWPSAQSLLTNAIRMRVSRSVWHACTRIAPMGAMTEFRGRQSSSTPALPRLTPSLGTDSPTPASPKRQFRSSRRGFASVRTTRACSFGCLPSQLLIISSVITMKRLRSAATIVDAQSHSVGPGPTHVVAGPQPSRPASRRRGKRLRLTSGTRSHRSGGMGNVLRRATIQRSDSCGSHPRRAGVKAALRVANTGGGC